MKIAILAVAVAVLGIAGCGSITKAQPSANQARGASQQWSIPSFVHTWFRVCSCAGWRLLW